jgi:hypothetical protein
MTTRATVLSLVLLAGCASAPEPASEAGPSDYAVAIIGTPFVFAFRVVTCAATAVIAGPTAGALVLTPDPEPGLAYLRDGLAQNCGLPYGLGVPVAGYEEEYYDEYPSEEEEPYGEYPSEPDESAPDSGQPRPLIP